MHYYCIFLEGREISFSFELGQTLLAGNKNSVNNPRKLVAAIRFSGQRYITLHGFRLVILIDNSNITMFIYTLTIFKVVSYPCIVATKKKFQLHGKFNRFC